MNIIPHSIESNPDITIFAPGQAGSVITEIWTEKRYTREYRIKAGDIVLDIGANVGIFSVFAASLGAKVYAFEPNPESFAMLSRNIEANGYSGRITAFECAVSGVSGYVDLQIPDSDSIYALGSATISAEVKQTLSDRQNLLFKTVQARARTLGEILGEILSRGENVDLLKMDCEGAELQILRSLDKALAGRIRHVSMETHDGYAEKEIASLLNEKGFAIGEYTKRSGAFRTGHCSAMNAFVNEGAPSAPGRSIVAILKAPESGFAGEAIAFSAAGSFVLNDTSVPMRYFWSVDRAPSKEDGPDIICDFSQPGAHQVSCEIFSESSSSHCNAGILILEKEYYRRAVDIHLKGPGEKVEVEVCGPTVFCVRRTDFPRGWEFDTAVISLLAPAGNLARDVTGFTYNGKVHSLDGEYAEIEISPVCLGEDLRFSLAPTHRQVVLRVGWWAKRRSEGNGPLTMRDALGRIVMGRINAAIEIEIEALSETLFRIPKRMMPSEWTPRYAKIGIAVSPSNGRIPPLDGVFECLGNRVPLKEWYYEAVIGPPLPAGDIDFSIRPENKQKLKIDWWVE